MGGLHAPGVAWGGILMRRHVEAGDDLHHTWKLRGFLRVNRLDSPIGNGTVENFCHQMGTGNKVIGIFGPPGGLVNGIHPDQAPANFHRGTLLHMLIGIIVSHLLSERKSVRNKI